MGPGSVRRTFISIHSLYAEGDLARDPTILPIKYFNPLPLRRGRPILSIGGRHRHHISIHSLYAEGDEIQFWPSVDTNISIHSLYAEGDAPALLFRTSKRDFNPLPLRRGRLYAQKCKMRSSKDFNPLPLRRGRLRRALHMHLWDSFQSTPSTQRETRYFFQFQQLIPYFNPLPLRRGRLIDKVTREPIIYFNPLPLRRGRLDT